MSCDHMMKIGLQLILTAYTGTTGKWEKSLWPAKKYIPFNFGSRSSVQSYNQIADIAIPVTVNDERKIQENFQNLFNSITTNDQGKSELYRQTLMQEVACERQASDAMKEELRITRNRSRDKKMKYKISGKFKNVVATKRGTGISNDTIPIHLYDLGYYEGDWEKFCDPKEIHEPFLYYPDHEAKKARMIVCRMVYEQRKFDKEGVAACALYKYCMMMRPKVDEILDTFLNTFSMNDTAKKQNLAWRGPFNETTPCYNTTMEEFSKQCIEPGNAFHVMFKQIFARACTYKGLTTETILATIEKACRGKFMPAVINWAPYYTTIYVRKF